MPSYIESYLLGWSNNIPITILKNNDEDVCIKKMRQRNNLTSSDKDDAIDDIKDEDDNENDDNDHEV